jgi:SNF2 family DNA or RNA helicase
MLRAEIVGQTGKVEPFRLRYYQVQAVLHLLMMKRMVLGDATGIGKTVEVIAFLCYLWEKEKYQEKCIVVCPKSVRRQWADEISRFTTGIKAFVADGSLAQRKAAYEAWAAQPMGPAHEKAVLILNYHALLKDWREGMVIPLIEDGPKKGQPDPKKPIIPGLLDRITASQKDTIIVFDEATAFKNTGTKRWEVCNELSLRSDRVYGLTATLLKNNLMEGFAIYKVIYARLFATKTKFMEDFCVTQLQPVKGGRKIPFVVGYRNLDHFRLRIDPFFLGRPKHEVSDELPKLTTKEIVCELSPAEDALYAKALSGILELGDGTIKDYEENVAFVALTYCQQVVNSPTMLRYEDGASVDIGIMDEPVEVETLSSKEEALLELLTEGDLQGEKVIVYTRYASHVPRLQKVLAQYDIKSVAITGDIKDTESNPRRRQAQQAFQTDPNTPVIIITNAGGEGINLQAAAAMVFLDAPWSWGDYVQLLGRPIRIGSPHQNVYAIHIVAERPAKKAKDRQTIDHHTLELLRKKKDLIDSVLGEAAVGALDFGDSSFKKELVKRLVA